MGAARCGMCLEDGRSDVLMKKCANVTICKCANQAI
jgi:hypothetical protein